MATSSQPAPDEVGERETVARRPSPAPPAVGAPSLLIAGVVFLFTFAAYAMTAYRTVPFWDAGEFITTSHILGIPHQPSTPLYVLIGRLAAIVPVGSIAYRVNLLSSLAAAMAAAFTYLAGIYLARRALPSSRLAQEAAAVSAALFCAFASTIWFNAVEAEVYALSNTVMAACMWAVLRWRESRDPDDRVLLVIAYLLALSVGIHLGTVLVLPGLAVMVALAHPRRLMNGAALAAWFAVPLLYFMIDSSGRTQSGSATHGLALALAVTVAVFAFFFTRSQVRWSLIGWAVALALLGLSVHGFLLIRAGLNPVINEADPSTWSALMSTLRREQYPVSNIFARRADFAFQIDMFLRYAREQWPFLPVALAGVAPLLVALGGGFRQWQRDRHGFFMMLTHLFFLGAFLIIYLNFTDNEVRERDYFFAGLYQMLALWIGLALGWLVVEASRRGAGLVAAAIVLLVSLAPMARGWHMHDRSTDFIARDYAYNMLAPLPQNAILFTNGDNDTFPVWYMQHVEGFRTDVRVVNLSLLNTPWYIKQIRDGNEAAGVEPVPFNLDDDRIDALRPRLDQHGRLLLVKDQAVQRILADNAWQLPTYLAVTVPDRMGLEPQLTMECLSNRIHPEATPVRINVEQCRECMYEKFTELRGLLREDGTTDERMYKTENESRLIQNYSAIHFYMAVDYDRNGKTEEALAEALRAEAITPGFTGNRHFLGLLYEDLGRLEEAENHYQRVLSEYGPDFRTLHGLGALLERRGRLEEAMPLLEQSVALAGGEHFEPHAALFDIYAALGRREQAVGVLDRWLAMHPDDVRVREVRDAVGRGEEPSGGDQTQ